MEAKKAIKVIKCMHKGNPTPEQKEALEEAYKALERQTDVSKKNDYTDKSDVYVFEGKELSAEELIVELAEHSKIFLDFEEFEKSGVKVDL